MYTLEKQDIIKKIEIIHSIYLYNIMDRISKNIIPKVKKLIIYGFFTGFCVGCIPNKLTIHYKGKKYNYLNIPLITGVICTTGIILSPLLMVNYFFNGTFIDKFIDKYDIHLERYHQCDGNNDKYAYPSVLIINIQSNKQYTTQS